MDISQIGAMVRENRESKGMSQRQYAKLVNLPQTTISQLESGQLDNVKLETLRRFVSGTSLELGFVLKPVK